MKMPMHHEAYEEMKMTKILGMALRYFLDLHLNSIFIIHLQKNAPYSEEPTNKMTPHHPLYVLWQREWDVSVI